MPYTLEDDIIKAAVRLVASFEGFADLDDTDFLDQAVVSRLAFIKLQNAVLAWAKHPAVRVEVGK